MARKKNVELEAEIKDLLNQILVKLQNVKTPNIDTENEDEDCGWSRIPASFVYDDDRTALGSIKVIAEAMLKDLDCEYDSYDIHKMARVYYSSFCNG